jgi:hypothetical protein
MPKAMTPTTATEKRESSRRIFMKMRVEMWSRYYSKSDSPSVEKNEPP